MMLQKPKISHILFATDLSDNANRAFDYAVSLAESCNAAIPTCSLIFREVLVETGNPADRILHHAGTGNYDILVMGNRGLGLIQATLMGSISRKVLQGSPISVLIVPMTMESNKKATTNRSRLAPPFFEP